MQQIVRELAGCVSEVMYVYPSEGHTVLRFFSAEWEVAFCGHGIIAAMYTLIKNDPVMSFDPITRIHMGGQELLVRNEIAAALRIAPDEISENHRIACINAGLSTLLSLHLDQQHLKEFCLANGIEIICVFSIETSSAGNRYRTRMFAPVFGYLEDPATGSGNAALGYYLLEEGTWDGHMIAIERGKVREHPNIIRIVSDASKVQHSVFFGGNAVVRIGGEYLLYS